MESPDADNPPSPEPRKAWDEFLSGKLSDFAAALRKDSSAQQSPSEEELQDCPPEVLAELEELQSCLILFDQLRATAPDPEPPPPIQPLTPPLPAKLLAETVELSQDPSKTEIDTQSPTPDVSGLKLGRFELGQKLGEGTYGIVYVANDPKLKRLVALKAPRLEAAFRNDLRERFLREGESAARLTHPNIVTVFEAVSEGPVSLIVSEYVQGPNLGAWLLARKRPVPPRHAAQLVAALADAVAHAHEQKVLHRDIKPSNILLAPRGADVPDYADLDRFHPKLTDFGLAKLLETQDATLSGAIVGTPAYMPPEQIAGRHDDVGPAADIYALGMVLYELLNGSNPFNKPSITETIHNVTQEDVPPLTKMRRDVSKDLETICLKCLRREPKERFTSARELADDLRRYLDGRPIKAREIPWTERTAKWCRRYPALTTVTSIAFLLLVSLLGVTLKSLIEINKTNQTLAKLNKELDASNRKRELHVLIASLIETVDAWDQANMDVILDRLNQSLPAEGEKDLRTFAWWFLHNQIRASKPLQKLPEGEVEIALHPHEPLLAVGGEDCVIHLWNAAKNQHLAELRGHTIGPIEQLNFFIGNDPEGKPRNWLISAAGDGTARVWDLDTKSQILVINHQHPETWEAPDSPPWLPTAIPLGDRAEFIATGGPDGFVRIWNSSDGSMVREFNSFTHDVRDLLAIPKTEILIASSAHEDHGLKFWNWTDGLPHKRFSKNILDLGDYQWSEALKISPDGTMLAVGCSGSKVYLFSLGENFGEKIVEHNFPWGIRALDWRQDGSLIIGMERQIMFNANPRNPDPRNWKPLIGHRNMITAVADVPSINRFFSADSSGYVLEWPLESLICNTPLPESVVPSSDIAWNGPHFSIRLSDGFYLIHRDQKRPIWVAPQEGSESNSWHLPLNAGKGILVLHPSNQKDTLAAYSLPSSGERPKDQPPDWTLMLDPIRTQLAGEPRLDVVRAGSISPDGNLLALTCDKAVWLIDTRSGELIHTLPFKITVHDLQFSPQGDRLYTSNGSGIVSIWNTADWSLEHSFQAHGKNVTAKCLTISADGKLFATSGQDSKAKVWDASTRELIAEFNTPNRVDELVFMDDGKTLFCRRMQDFQIVSIPLKTPMLNWKKFTEGTRISAAPDGNTIAILSRQGYLDIIQGKE